MVYLMPCFIKKHLKNSALVLSTLSVLSFSGVAYAESEGDYDLEGLLNSISSTDLIDQASTAYRGFIVPNGYVSILPKQLDMLTQGLPKTRMLINKISARAGTPAGQIILKQSQFEKLMARYQSGGTTYKPVRTKAPMVKKSQPETLLDRFLPKKSTSMKKKSSVFGTDSGAKYVGANLGYIVDDFFGGLTIDAKAGYYFTDDWAAEVRVGKTLTQDSDTFGLDFTSALLAKRDFDVIEGYNVYATAGLALLSANGTSVDVAFGGGIEYDLNDTMALYADYISYGFFDINQVSAGLLYRL